ncbi:hypothetical protein BAUCODRAFT_125121 [Baudoinia panamericana UAMH 10762]|uniref:NADH-ubiquinone oxidoreductase 17.8 kDa subunit n=1 Tax=Baudoinia panamericana (strain UAMH 10762) TaxID=717646 RepID=M2N3E5_BAUPA|nr:uncharacterized protein BAUCODRAFT_125121 [Baudoinia panamericana UAMH 10762]EMC93245.1 hypothetical protein BAUCODRAFT_125121 [Baudoinia panamericana UAMH 10762]
MQLLQKTALRSARRLRPQLQKQPRRYAGDSQGAHERFEPHGGHNQHPTHESFGAGFYVTIATIPASIALYYLTRQGTNEQPWATRFIRDTYNDYAVKWARRNDLHTQAVEQAAADRVLFLNESSQNPRTVDVRFPEQLNTGAPWNVPAGHYANMDTVIAKYEKESFEAQERKLQQIRENNVPCEQPMPTLVKTSSPAGASGT